jgi:hypothetical protein
LYLGACGHQCGAEPKSLAGVRDRGGTMATTGPTAVRPAGRTRGTAGTPREGGENSEGPWDAQCLGRRGARTPRSGPARARVRTGAWRRGAGTTRLQNVSVCLRLTVFFPKFLNRSAQCGQQESCRSSYPLQLLQRPYRVFLNGFCRNVVPTSNAGLSGKTGGTVSRSSFSLISTQNLKCQST